MASSNPTLEELWYGSGRSSNPVGDEIVLGVGADGVARPIDPTLGMGARVARSSPKGVTGSGAMVRGHSTFQGAYGSYGAYGGYNFGDTSVPTALTGADRVLASAKMQAVIVALRTAMSLAKLRIAATPSAGWSVAAAAALALIIPPSTSLGAKLIAGSASNETKQDTLNALSIIDGLINNLEAQIPTVLDGGMSADSWFGGAFPIKDGISSVLATVDENSTGNNLSSTINDSESTVADIVNRAVNTAGNIINAAGNAANDAANAINSYPKLFLFGGLALAGLVAYVYLTGPGKVASRIASRFQGFSVTRVRKAARKHRRRARR